MKKITLLMMLLFLGTVSHSQTQYIYTIAGDGSGGHANNNCIASDASFYFLNGGVVVDTSGNIFIPDSGGHWIRKISPGGVVTVVAGTNTPGYNGDGILATTAQLYTPMTIALDDEGNIYIADYTNYRVRKVDALTGMISTFAGTGVQGYNGDSIPATSADVANVFGMAVDHSGNVFFSDGVNSRVRKVDAITGYITTIAGNGVSGYSGDGLIGTAAQVDYPKGICVDDLGNVYIADKNNHRVRKVDHLTGIISTVAGNGVPGYNGDNILAINANLNEPWSLAFDTAGNLYIADSQNHRIRKVDSTGIITTVAGDGTSGFYGDGGVSTAAKFATPRGVFVDRNNNIYVSDVYNHSIRMVTNYVDTSYVWPGDADNNNIVDNNDLFSVGMYLNQVGPARASVSNIWQADSCSNWGINQLNCNLKHADSDGSGNILADDTVAINLNFSAAHAYAPLDNEARTSDPDFYFVTGSTSYLAGSTVDVEVWLGTSSLPVSELFGVSFDINFNTSLVQPGSAGIVYPASWFGAFSGDALRISKINETAGIAYGALVRTDGHTINGYGKIADFKFKVNSNVPFLDSLNLGVLAYNAIDNGMISKYFNVLNPATGAATGISAIDNSSEIKIYPNPSNGIYNIQYTSELAGQKKNISIYNVLGERIYLSDEKVETSNIDLTSQPSGIYFITIETEDHKLIKDRIIKQ